MSPPKELRRNNALDLAIRKELAILGSLPPHDQGGFFDQYGLINSDDGLEIEPQIDNI